MFMDTKEIKRILGEIKNELYKTLESGAIPYEEVEKILSKYGLIGYAVSDTSDFCTVVDDDGHVAVVEVCFEFEKHLIDEIHKIQTFVYDIHEWTIVDTDETLNAAIRITANINGARQFALKMFGDNYSMRTVNDEPYHYHETNSTILKLVSTDTLHIWYM